MRLQTALFPPAREVLPHQIATSAPQKLHVMNNENIVQPAQGVLVFQLPRATPVMRISSAKHI